jgi:hypothetical protein
MTGRRCLHDCADEVGLVVGLPSLRCGRLAQRFDRDGELAAGAHWCHTPPDTPLTARTG